jgi:hypothetical protein
MYAGLGEMVAPCIAMVAAATAYPVPTTVTVVPTEADDGLMTDIDGETTVKPIVLYAPPTAVNENVRRPAGVPAVAAKEFIVGDGHADGAANGAVVVCAAPFRFANVGV